MRDRILRVSFERLEAREVVENRRVVGEPFVRSREDGDAERIAPRRVVRVGAPERVPTEVDLEQPPQLGDRLGVIVDAQIADPVDSLTRLGGRTGTLDDDRRGLLSRESRYRRSISSTTSSPARMFP